MRWDLWRSQRPSHTETPAPVEIPVAGRWRALNGPARRFPATHSHARTHAIDLTYHLSGETAPAFGWLWPLSRRPHHCPAFGNPVLALADGVVVATADRQRDYAGIAHLRRGSLQVAVGDRVAIGQRLAECGNSGNSCYLDDEGTEHIGVPKDTTYFTPPSG